MGNIRPLVAADLPEAQRIVRHAFGTFMGVPDLDNFWTDRDHVYGRFGAEHTAAFAADHDNALAAVSYVTNWGSVGVLGPVCVRPDLWNSGIAQPLISAACDQFERWGTRHAGLCTFPHSPKHVWLYQKFGFYPRFLTPVLGAPASQNGARSVPSDVRYAKLSVSERSDAETAARLVADQVYEGLDLTGEIRTVAARNLGDTLLLWEGDNRLAGFAICHWGPASEAGEGCLYIKFGAVRPGPCAADRFGKLVQMARVLASSVGMPNVLAGVNLAREEAYRHLLANEFKTRFFLVTMHRPNEEAYSKPGLFVLDDWR